jgi:nitrite reductase/ring-hydroxylating ferredoxin subunit
METTNTLVRAAENPAIDRVAEPLSKAVRGAYEAGGPLGQQTKNALHGVWLGHPLHPVFTDIPIGAWTTALALDAASNGDSGMRRAATFAMGVGLTGALGAAVTGLTDWSETDGQSRRAGLIHGLLNLTATTLFATAFALRQKDSHDGGRKCAWTGYAIALGAAYLGGDLVYGQRLGVTHADVELPEEFTPILASAALAESSMVRARAGNTDVLLVRQRGRVCALAHACAHLGGPLSEGTLKDGSVVCPWHGSEFALEDGRVLNGPSTHNQPFLVARERDGQIEIKGRARGD